RNRTSRGAVDRLRRRHRADRVLPATRHRSGGGGAGRERAAPPVSSRRKADGVMTNPLHDALPDVALEVRDLALHIGGLVALAGISFSVPTGRIVSLIGPNGAGKTTAFNVITGYLRPTRGTILCGGRDLTRLAPERIAALGVVRTFQRTSLFAGCSVFDNVLMALHLVGRAGMVGAVLRLPAFRREERRLRAEAATIIAFVGLERRANDLAANL